MDLASDPPAAAADLWDTATAIRQLAKEIEELLPVAATEGDHPEVEDLWVCLGGVKGLLLPVFDQGGAIVACHEASANS